MYVIGKLHHIILAYFVSLTKYYEKFLKSFVIKYRFIWKSNTMKFKTLIVLIFIFVLPVWGQAPDSSASKQQKKEEKKVRKEEKKELDDQKSDKEKAKKQRLEGFIDLNANGIDDRIETGKGKGKGKDRFIDLDGDGICDGQESALGLRKVNRKRKGQSRNK